MLLLEGRAERERRWWRGVRSLLAWAIAWLLAPHTREGKKPLSPAAILGEEKASGQPDDTVYGTPAELRRIVTGGSGGKK